MTPHKRTILAVFGWLATAYAADIITVEHPRPVLVLATELEKRYGYPVTYEEAPPDGSDLRSETLPNGRTYRSAPDVPIVFHVPELRVGAPANAALNRVPIGMPDVILRMLDEYHSIAHGRRFTVLFEGGYAHIIPANRLTNHKAEPFEPILNTVVTLVEKGVSCNTALDSLLNQVSAVRGIRIVKGVVPMSPLFRHECVVNVSKMPAREVLAGILMQLGTRGASHDPLYSWALLYDANVDKYFLSTSVIPDLNAAAETVPAPPPQSNSSVDAGTSKEQQRLSVPSDKKR